MSEIVTGPLGPRNPLEEMQAQIDHLETQNRLLSSALDAVASLLAVNKTEGNIDAAVVFIRKTLAEEEK